MDSIYVCFNFRSVSVYSDSPDEYDRMYQTVYKPLARFLYSHPDFKFSFSFTGPQLLYYKKKRNEFLTIIKELVDRNQVEILGGGFYAPVLPLLFPVDRNTQIDMLSTEIRQTVGKRPRGITLFGDIWDSSLVNNLQTCGIEYTLLDSCSIPENKRNFLYNIMHDLGKAVEIFPYYNEFIPPADMTCDVFTKNILKAIEKTEKQDDYYQINPDKIVILSMNYQTVSELVGAKWFEQFDSYLKENLDSRIKTGTIDEYRKNQSIKVPAYIPTAMNRTLDNWCGYLVRDRNRTSFKNTVYNFMANTIR